MPAGGCSKDQRKIVTAVGRELLASFGPSDQGGSGRQTSDAADKEQEQAKTKTFQRMKKQKLTDEQ